MDRGGRGGGDAEGREGLGGIEVGRLEVGGEKWGKVGR